MVFYQVDFACSFQGKHISPTKQRVRFEFGIANPLKVRQGCVGVACRGEEHSVEFVWSLTSGKRVVIWDNENIIYMDKHKCGICVDSKFEYSFDCYFQQHRRERAFCKLVAHPFTPSGIDGITLAGRRFDLFINGQSFFDFLKLYELGMIPDQEPSRLLESPYYSPDLWTSRTSATSFNITPPDHITIRNANNQAQALSEGYVEDDDDTSVFAFARPANISCSTMAAAPPTWDDYNQAFSPASATNASRSVSSSITNSTHNKNYDDKRKHQNGLTTFQTIHSAFCPIPEEKEEEEIDLIDLSGGDESFLASQTRNLQQQNQEKDQYSSLYTTSSSSFTPNSYVGANIYAMSNPKASSSRLSPFQPIGINISQPPLMPNYPFYNTQPQNYQQEAQHSQHHEHRNSYKY